MAYLDEETTISRRQQTRPCKTCGCPGAAHAHYSTNSAYSTSCARCGRADCPAFKPLRWWHK